MARTMYAEILGWMKPLVPAVRQDAAMHQYNKLSQECVEGCDRDGHVGSLFIGTVFSLVPSGKFYTFYASSNVTTREIQRDTAWWIAVERAANRLGVSVDHSDGDPCDIVMSCYFTDAELAS